eukprot:767517-Hanusia_phi.AAC.8
MCVKHTEPSRYPGRDPPQLQVDQAAVRPRSHARPEKPPDSARGALRQDSESYSSISVTERDL